jgi:hypothetical protein
MHPNELTEVRLRCPDLSVSLSEREPHEAIPALVRGHLDITVVQEWDDDVLLVPEGLAHRHLLNDLFDVALPIDHRLADRESVAITDLANDEWIVWSTGRICHDWLVRTASPRCGTMHRVHRLGTLDPTRAGRGRPGRRGDPTSRPRTRAPVRPVRAARPTANASHLRPVAAKHNNPPRHRLRDRGAPALRTGRSASKRTTAVGYEVTLHNQPKCPDQNPPAGVKE